MLWPLSLQKARYRLAKDRPYLSSALWAIVPVEKPGLGTMAIDRWWRLYYDPAVIAEWSTEELAGVLYHEVLHLLRDHSNRMKAFPPDIGNLAADAEINDDLREERVPLPGSPVYPETLGMDPGKLAEEYAAALSQQQNNTSKSSKGEPEEGEESESPSGAPSGNARDGEPGEQSGSSSSETGSSTVWSSGSTGHKAPWELGEPDESNPGISEAEAEIIRRRVAQDIKSHGRGKVPAHLDRWATEKLQPKVDWRRVLASSIRRAIGEVTGMADYSYRKPSRRQSIYDKILLPSLRRPKLKVAIIVDTSGSIYDRMLAQALAEIKQIIKNVGAEVTVLSVDARVHTIQQVFDPKKIKLVGGGGTDMRVGLEKAIELKPDVIIVLTDGYTPWPSEPPKVPVIVGLLDKDGDAPKWARKIIIEG